MEITDMRAVLLAIALLTAAGASAQDYPSKPIRIISGPGPDIIARVFGKKLGEAIGQPVIIENMPAAGGKVAMETLVKSRADGYTLVNYTSGLVMAEGLNVIPAGTSGEISAVALVAYLPFVLAVPASFPATSLQDLLSLARKTPGQLNYASGGNGTPPHLATELMKAMANVNIVHVPYKGIDQAAVALLGGQVQMLITTLSAVTAQAQAGKLRLLAVTSGQRSRLAPGVPSFIEAGLAGYEMSGWNGFIAPPGLPAPLANRINAEFLRAARESDLQQQLAPLGFEPVLGDYTPERFGEFIRNEANKWSRLVKQVGVKID